MKSYLDITELSNVRKKYEKNKEHKLLRHALTQNPLDKVVSSFDTIQSQDFNFSIDLKTLPVSNQKRSGRCWIFSASTILREIINKKLNVKDQFEISQNYISYFDKLEKYNYYLENIIDLALNKEPHNGRKMAFLLSGVGDGGQWDMYVSLVKKYGIVPKAVFSETEQSNNTHLSTSLCNSAMRKFASEVYRAIQEGKAKDELEEIKGVYMNKIYALLTDCFGLPPTKFDYEYTDADGAYHILKNYKPKKFFDEFVGEEIDEYVSLIHAPTKDKEYYQTYHVELVGNVLDGKPITHLNLPLERIQELIIQQLKDGLPVWFGADVSYYGDRPNGSWNDQVYDYQSAFDLDFKFDKADMLDYSNSAMNHAMVLTGVNLVNDKPTKWKIENSWGSDTGKNGYYIMTQSWFESFFYQAAVKRKYLNDKEVEALNKKAKMLPPWDPFGTLAD